MPFTADQIAALIQRHAVALQLWAGRKCVMAEDLVQEAFCRLAIQDPPPDRPVAWLYRVVRNLAETQRLSSKRRRSREQQVSAAESVDVDPSELLIVDEAVQAVSQLDDPLREVVTARIWGRLTFAEIGVLCNISTPTASRRYREALEQLRKLLSVPCPTSPR